MGVISSYRIGRNPLSEAISSVPADRDEIPVDALIDAGMPDEVFLVRGHGLPRGYRVYAYEPRRGGIGVMVFGPRSRKRAKWHTRVRNMQQVERWLDNLATNLRGAERERRARRAAAAQAAGDVKVGDIFAVDWGYDQTNIDFYEVTKVMRRMVAARPIAKRRVKSMGPYNEVVPVPGKYTGPAKRYRIGAVGRSGLPYIKTEYGTAFKWDGRPKRETDSLYGH